MNFEKEKEKGKGNVLIFGAKVDKIKQYQREESNVQVKDWKQ